MRIHDYVQVVLRNWLLVVATVAVGVAAAAILAISLPPSYQASAHVVFSGHAATGQDLAYAGSYVQGRMQTYKTLGSSDSLVGAVRDTLGTSESVQSLDDRTRRGGGRSLSCTGCPTWQWRCRIVA